jgi:NADH:ubiquinone oxidoreductase subunit B-like Fe-S oxidoreductase
VHGCPPRPEAVIEGVAKAVLKLEALGKSSGAREAETREAAAKEAV